VASEGQRLNASPSLVQMLPLPPGKSLEITGAAAEPKDLKHRQQQQESQMEAHPRAVTANSFGEGFAYGKDLEEADQVSRNCLKDCSRKGFRPSEGRFSADKNQCRQTSKGFRRQTFRRPWRNRGAHEERSVDERSAGHGEDNVIVPDHQWCLGVF